jgi:hypothetical protein
MSGMKFSGIIKHIPLLRAVGVLSAVGIIATSVTFASLQSQQAVLTGNTIQSATADLRIGTSASTFSASRAGFTFADVVPGGPAMPADGHSFYLKNYGSAALNLKVAVNSAVTNASSVDLNKVSVQLTRIDTGSVQTMSLQSLLDAQASGGQALTDVINANSVVQYKLRAVMEADAFNGTGANVGAIDLVFSGVVNPSV